MKFKLMEDKVFETEEAFWKAIKKGFDVEKEHKKTVDSDFLTILKIAVDHISEHPDYYKALKKMENGLKGEDVEEKDEETEEKNEEGEEEKEEEKEEEEEEEE